MFYILYNHGKTYNKKGRWYISEFKNDVKKWFTNNECDITGKYNKSDFLKFIFDFDGISLTKDDFQKRKRVKNTVPSRFVVAQKEQMENNALDGKR